MQFCSSGLYVRTYVCVCSIFSHWFHHALYSVQLPKRCPDAIDLQNFRLILDIPVKIIESISKLKLHKLHTNNAGHYICIYIFDTTWAKNNCTQCLCLLLILQFSLMQFSKTTKIFCWIQFSYDAENTNLLQSNSDDFLMEENIRVATKNTLSVFFWMF